MVMKKSSVILSLLILTLILGACTPPSNSNGTPGTVNAISSTITRSTPQITQTPTPAQPGQTPSLTITTTAPPLTQRTQYILSAELDYARRTLTITENVRYTNHSSSTLSDLELMVEANQESGVFQLVSISWADGSPIQNAVLTGERLTFPLPKGLNPGATVEIRLAYGLNLPSNRGVLSFGSRQVNLSGWYPYIPPYIVGKGWLIHPPGSVGEYQVYELADFNVNFILKNAPANLVVAASAANDAIAGGYHYIQTGARNFTLSLSTDYIQFSEQSGETLVTAYVFKGDETAGHASLDTTTRALMIYSSLFGPYTHNTLSVVEADFADGMEEDGLYFLGSEYFKAYAGSPACYLVALSAHETAHQWWYAMIGNDQAQEPWLDEALATYSERLFYEQEYPDLVDWWWQTRVQAYAPQGWVDSTIYDFKAFRPYVNAVYLREATFLEKLRQALGDKVFFAFLRGYFNSVQKEPQALSDAQQFWSILNQYTSLDLSELKSGYFSK